MLVSDLPTLAESDGYRAVKFDIKQGWNHTLLWILGGDNVAADFRLEPTHFTLQVEQMRLHEIATLPLARVIAEAFNVLMVNGVANKSVEGTIRRVVHRSREGWSPQPHNYF